MKEKSPAGVNGTGFLKSSGDDNGSFSKIHGGLKALNTPMGRYWPVLTLDYFRVQA